MVAIILIFMMLPITATAQAINGQVVDDASGRPLAYVNIGIVGTYMGTVSDENGDFTLEVRNQLSDSRVRFSVIGYTPKVLLLQELKEGIPTINLVKERVELPEISISKSKLKEKRKGTRATSKNIVTGWNAKLKGGEHGIRIKVDDKPVYVKSLYFHVANNGFEEVLLRVHFRKFEKDKPSQHIVNNDILVPVRVKSGWVRVNLEKYNLVFEEDVAVTLQPVQRKGVCVDTKWCFHLSANMFELFSTSWLVYKMSSEAEWKVKKNWSPGIYLRVYE